MNNKLSNVAERTSLWQLNGIISRSSDHKMMNHGSSDASGRDESNEP